jgi:TIR domain
VKWPREGRIDPAHAWGVVAVGTAGLVAIPTILATLHATDTTFLWWWPTGWMAIPAAIFLAGTALVALSARRPGRAPQPLSHARGAAGSDQEPVPRGPASADKQVPEPGPCGTAFNPHAADPPGHVFLSAAPEDAGPAERLQHDLENAGIHVWRDATDLQPGDDQPAVIRRAITDAALVFLACFSSRSVALTKSYVNVQLLLAVDQQQMRRPDMPWLIPVRFDDCPLPDIDLGGGRTLTTLTSADLFGLQRDAQAARLLAAIQQILGQPLVTESNPNQQS